MFSILSLKKQYLSELKAEKIKYGSVPGDILSEKDIAALPEPVKRYFRVCGLIGKKKMNWAFAIWKDVYFKNLPKKKWKRADYHQFNAIPEPGRIVYMKARIASILPIEARDKYQNGHGNMLIRFLKLITLTDAKGVEMDKSALVTILAEALLFPAYALQPYIQWTAISSNIAEALIQYNGIEAKGQFYFNDSAEFIRFETNDRFKALSGNNYEKCKWFITACDYKEKNGTRFPTDLRGFWDNEMGGLEYFRGKIENIEYD